ncbi:MAG: hypothetical protein GY913_30905 [Proteobacteria bacterium]|nr:hypothetical protein [Pseudomonadota bacterium]MCP4921327.1 hypothetical protein [Pseudomonadota bacterium]
MFALLSLLACQPEAPERVPGDLPRTGETLETINGKNVTQSMLDAHLRAMPAEVRTQLEEQGAIDQLKDQVIVQDTLYQEALKLNVHQDEDVKAMLVIAEREALVEALLRQIADERTSDAALQEWYESHKVQFRKDEVNIRQIVVQDAASAQAAFDKASAPGADWAAVAGELSIDPRAKENGGEIGWVSKKDMPPQLAGALEGAAAGAVIGPIEVPGGAYLVLNVVDVRELVPFEDVKAEIKPTVQQEVVRDYVTELREASAPAEATLGAPEAAPAAEDHAGHDHGPGEGH